MKNRSIFNVSCIYDGRKNLNDMNILIYNSEESWYLKSQNIFAETLVDIHPFLARYNPRPYMKNGFEIANQYEAFAKYMLITISLIDLVSLIGICRDGIAISRVHDISHILRSDRFLGMDLLKAEEITDYDMEIVILDSNLDL